jgi:hypothetical protein
MVGRPKSDTKKCQEASKAKQKLQAHAVAAYKEELIKKVAGLLSCGAQAVCNKYMALHKQETRKEIHLNHATIINHSNGKCT